MLISQKDDPPKRVLLATDLSARCDRATDRAVVLAKLWNAELIVLHVMELGPASAGPPYSPSWRLKYDPQERAVRRVRSEIGEILPDVSVIVEQGDPAERLLQVAEARSVDLIVTGVARDEPFGRAVVGSTVKTLLGQVSCPLLIVRRRGLRPYRHIVTATDFSLASREALERAVRLFPHASHAVFHAYSAGYAALASDVEEGRRQQGNVAAQECREFLAASDLLGLGSRLPQAILEYGPPGQLLNDYAHENDVDLAVMGTCGHGALYDMFIGSVAKKLAMSVPCDALIIRPRQT